MSKKNILIIAAIEDESCGNFEKIQADGPAVAYSGLGKINATSALMRLLQHYHNRKWIEHIDAVLNLGTVGSASVNEGQVVQVEKFIQRDMLCYPLSENYRTPFEEDLGYLDVETCGLWQKVSCGTGDSFVNTDHMKMRTGPELPYDVVDMEGYAYAKVCRAWGVNFYSLKYVSDSGSAKSWKDNLETASKALAHEARSLISLLK